MVDIVNLHGQGSGQRKCYEALIAIPCECGFATIHSFSNLFFLLNEVLIEFASHFMSGLFAVVHAVCTVATPSMREHTCVLSTRSSL